MRFTIERIRTIVLAAGVLLVLAIVAFLAFDKFKRAVPRDIPKRLGLEIQQEANGVTYIQDHGGHTIFKIHAARVIQLRNSHATLHDVEIDLYGQDGRRVDIIQGGEFDYDQKTGVATAAGPVQIALTIPVGGVAPGNQPSAKNLVRARTSGITFLQKTGIVSTSQRVDFSSAQGSGSALGASYNSDTGLLILDSAVQITAQPRPGSNTGPIEIHAGHAEFDRDRRLVSLTGVTAKMRTGQASAGLSQIDVRDDGSVARLTASGGLTLSTTAGSRIAAPAGQMDFTAKNQPRSAHLAGGVTLASRQPGRFTTGSASTADLAFAAAGELRHLHLEDDVRMRAQQQSQSTVQGRVVPLLLTRAWRSGVADVDFRPAARGQVEPALLHGSGGVVLTGETRRGSEPAQPSRLAADDLTGVFGPSSTLRTLTGVGHATLRQTAADGAIQTAAADRLQAHFAPAAVPATRVRQQPGGAVPAAAQVESAEFDGHVVLDNQPAAQPGTQQQPLHATAGRALYQSAGQWLHLTESPRLTAAGMDLTADALDFSQQSGEGFARGNVKATWIGAATPATPQAFSLGGRAPAHAIASEAEFHQSSGEAFFRGNARLWQDANSVSAPLLILNRAQQSLIARTATAAQPVTAVLLGAPQATPGSKSRASAPSIIRVRGGNLFYSGVHRTALFRAAPLAAVTAESGVVASSSDQVELFLSPPGNHAAAQVERMTARGQVVLRAQGRRGAGQQLAYNGSSGDYVLTGTPAAPPRLTDPLRGSVTGKVLIFHSRDDSVSIEGGRQETTTQTTAPR